MISEGCDSQCRWWRRELQTLSQEKIVALPWQFSYLICGGCCGETVLGGGQCPARKSSPLFSFFSTYTHTFDLCCLFVFVAVLPVILGLKQNKLLIQDPEGNSWQGGTLVLASQIENSILHSPSQSSPARGHCFSTSRIDEPWLLLAHTGLPAARSAG